jgi:hypothetical protein
MNHWYIPIAILALDIVLWLACEIQVRRRRITKSSELDKPIGYGPNSYVGPCGGKHIEGWDCLTCEMRRRAWLR